MRGKFSDFEDVLSAMCVSSIEKEKIRDIVNKQIFIHSYCSKEMNKLSFYIVGKKIEGIDVIKIFPDNIVVIETLDTSYTRMRNLSTLEDWNTDFILHISFKDCVAYAELCQVSDIVSAVFKKAKVLKYGVTDGSRVVLVEIQEHYIKGVEHEIQKEMVTYAFNKKLKLSKPLSPDNLTYVLLEYS